MIMKGGMLMALRYESSRFTKNADFSTREHYVQGNEIELIAELDAQLSLATAELHYDGSCAIDENLLDAANICENEQVHICNINNGERFITYAIKGERGSGMISVNGSAARRASVGDLLIITSFAQVHEDQVAGHEPQLVFVDEKNQQVGRRHLGIGRMSVELSPYES